MGAVRPADGRLVYLIMPQANTENFKIFLNHLQSHLGPRRVVTVMNNASWLRNWGRIEPLYLLSYSPDFNPIERLWLDLKTNYFATHSQEVLTDHPSFALRYYMEHQNICQSICGGEK